MTFHYLITDEKELELMKFEFHFRWSLEQYLNPKVGFQTVASNSWSHWLSSLNPWSKWSEYKNKSIVEGMKVKPCYSEKLLHLYTNSIFSMHYELWHFITRFLWSEKTILTKHSIFAILISSHGWKSSQFWLDAAYLIAKIRKFSEIWFL